jgi:hypothetical protein
LNNECGIQISFGSGDQSDVVVSCVQVTDAIKANDWSLFSGLCGYNLVAKVHDFGPSHIVSEPSVN